MSRSRMHPGLALPLLAAALTLTCVLRLMVDRSPDGTIGLAWPEASYAGFRWTAMIGAMIVGVSLATSGVLLQALLRNPLAEPFILGLSSGAGLGVMATLYVMHVVGTAGGGDLTEAIPAAGGALATLAIVYGLSQRRGWLDPLSMVLVGVVVTAVCGAGIMMFQHMVPTGLRSEFTAWLMGNVSETTTPRSLLTCGAIAAAGVLAATLVGRAMDAATLGDDEARGVGLSLGPLRLWLFILAGVLAAVSVALAGPIGFVGLIAPHAARMILGPRHAPLVPAAAVIGAVVLIAADAGRQAIDLGAGRMPVGIFTAFLGGPMFIWLLRSGKGQA
jgi:iron complex transport system permease protein